MADRDIQLPEGVPPLNTFYFYLTEGCNLACRHCWIAPSHQLNGNTGGHLSLDLFELSIEEGLPLGLRSVKLTGGEPLLHPDFIQMVDVLKENDLGLIIETNGTLLTSSMARYLKDNSTNASISVSLDGSDANSHDVFRGVKGSFDAACQGFRYLVEVGYKPQVIMSLHSGNVNEIEQLVSLAEKMGAGSVKFNIIQPAGRGEKMVQKGTVLDIEQLIKLGKWVEKDLQARTSISLHYSWPMAFHGLNYLLERKPYSCGIFSILGVLSDGHLAMCGIGALEADLVYGQLGKDSLASIWINNATLKDLRRALPRQLEGICSDCLMREQCFGYCVAENYHVSHRLTAAYWFCQQAEAAGLFPAGRRYSKSIGG